MSAELVTVRDLQVSFAAGRGRIQAVNGISFAVSPGQIVAIVGESGCGKSVTARTLIGLAGEGAVIQAAELTLDGIDLRTVRGRGWRALRGRRVGFVPQDALNSLDPLRRVGTEIAEPLREHHIAADRDIRAETLRLLGAAGVPDPAVRARQYPHELSGGLRQRALIASAIAARPRLLIADEPTTALDATVQAQVLRLLRRLADDGMAILLISHDLGAVAEIADHVLVMRDGRFVEDGPAARVLKSPRHPYARSLVEAVAGLDRPAGHRASPAAGRTVLAGYGLVKRYGTGGHAARTAVDEVSIEVSAGQAVGVVGESGSGKTTLGRMLVGLITPDAGHVEVAGVQWQRLRGTSLREARRRVQMIYQNPLASFDPRYTARQLLDEPLRAARASRAGRAEELLSHVGLSASVLTRRARELSGGERQRLAIARALASVPEVIVCDEPVSALDALIRAQVLDVLEDVRRRLGLGYVFISHDLGVVRRLCDHVLVMKDGRVVESGAIEAVFDAPRHPYTRALLEAVPRLHTEQPAYTKDDAT